MRDHLDWTTTAGATGNRTLADLLLDYLVQLRVDYVFGVPGGAIEPLFDALARRARQPIASGVKLVVSRHEAGAAFMAEGYARESGRLGVCCATTGPGSTNLITGVASAYLENVPLLVITPQTRLASFGRQAFQESSSDAVDTVGMFSHCTRYNSLVSHPEQLEYKLFAALQLALRPPRGPVHLSIPLDLMGHGAADRLPAYCAQCLLPGHPIPDEDVMNRLWATLAVSPNPVLFLDRGAAEAMPHILAYAEHGRIPIACAPGGKGVLPAGHPLFRGVFGFGGHRSAQALMEGADLILAVGTTLGEIASGGWDQHCLLTDRLVHIDTDPEHFNRAPMARLHVHGEPRLVFQELLRRQVARDRAAVAADPPPPLQESAMGFTMDPLQPTPGGGAGLSPAMVMETLAERLPAEARYAVDTGNSWAWATHYLHPREAGRYQVGMGFGAMGWGIGAAVGMALGARGAPVACITGDGAFLMSGQELTAAVEQRLPVIFVVLNNRELGMVKHGQRLSGAEPIGFELPPVNFAAMAEAMGGLGVRIETPQQLEAVAWEAICRRPGPTVLDVVVDPEAVPPMGVRVKTLKAEATLDPAG